VQPPLPPPIPPGADTVPEPDAEPAAEGALARSQAARRRRVLDATLQLAAAGGFDAVQMRDVAAAADVALGTVYRYFASKERLLLEAMAEQQADLRAYLDVHPPREPTPAGRVVSVLRGANRSLREFPDVTAAMVRSFGTAQIENADIVRRVTEIMTGIITSAIHAPERRAATENEVRVARILMQVWLSSLNGWVCGVDGPDRVDDDLAAAAALLLS
jgi:AcrR family transcriptional regulator